MPSRWGKPESQYPGQPTLCKEVVGPFQTWKDLKRLLNRKTSAQVCKQEAFTRTLDDQFEMAHADAEKEMSIEEDRDILPAHRKKGHPCSMERQDTVLTTQDEISEWKLQAEKQRKGRSMMECEASTSIAVLSSSSNASDSTDDEDDVVQVSVGDSLPDQTRASQNAITPALNRTQATYRKYIMMNTEMAGAWGTTPLSSIFTRRQSEDRG